MELTAAHDAFADAVAWAARSLPARPTSAVLGGISLRAESGDAGQDTSQDASRPGRLTVSGFDYETSATASAAARVGSGGSVLVSGRLLAEIARALPCADVSVKVLGSKVLIACGGYQYTLQSMPADDYPRLPALPATVGHVAGDLLAAAVAQVGVAAGRDDSLPFLTGVRVELGADTLRFVATDRYRLAVREIPWVRESAGAVADAGAGARLGSDGVGGVALVPGRVLHEVTRSLASADRVDIALAADGAASDGPGLIGFSATDRESTARLLDGEFIKYERIFPAAYSGHAVIETAPLIQAVKAIALVADRTAPLRLAFSPGRVRVEASSGDAAEATVTLDASFAGTRDADEFALAANSGYLLDGLSALQAPYAQLSFTTATKPAVLVGRLSSVASPSDPAAPELGYRYLFLPLRQLG
jgi:DNA polymerase-3 subunit beta